MTVDVDDSEYAADYLVLRKLVWVALLWLLVLISAISVIYVSHKNRLLFSEYQAYIDLRDDMEVEWGQLLLEQSALASHARVEQLATNKLNMLVPDASEIVMVSW